MYIQLFLNRVPAAIFLILVFSIQNWKLKIWRASFEFSTTLLSPLKYKKKINILLQIPLILYGFCFEFYQYM